MVQSIQQNNNYIYNVYLKYKIICRICQVHSGHLN